MPRPEEAGGDDPSHDCSPWYEGGLRFSCTRCGACCTGARGYVWVEACEAESMAVALGLSLDDFGRRYLRRVGERYALLEDVVTGDCVFLRDNRCLAYSARPSQCRSFPFWPANIRTPGTWRAAARECEGIGQGTEQGVRQDRPLVSAREIARLVTPGPYDGELDSGPKKPRGQRK